MTQWLMTVIPEFYKPTSVEVRHFEKLKFENPLLFQVSHEFTKLYDYMLSQDLSLMPPVAETLIKYRILDSKTSEDVIQYPKILKQCFLDNFKVHTTEIYFSDKQLIEINQRSDELFKSASLFYSTAKNVLEKIKLRELQNGAFTEDSLGMKGASCPSAFSSSV